jgi:hypothetical protein
MEHQPNSLRVARLLENVRQLLWLGKSALTQNAGAFCHISLMCLNFLLICAECITLQASKGQQA